MLRLIHTGFCFTQQAKHLERNIITLTYVSNTGVWKNIWAGVLIDCVGLPVMDVFFSQS